jgi:hypothetical protein
MRDEAAFKPAPYLIGHDSGICDERSTRFSFEYAFVHDRVNTESFFKNQCKRHTTPLGQYTNGVGKKQAAIHEKAQKQAAKEATVEV